MSVADAAGCSCPPHALSERPEINDECPVHGKNEAFAMCGHGFGWNGRSCETCASEAGAAVPEEEKPA